METSFSATFMRGGSSKGLFIHADELPANTENRDRVLLAAMGSPDQRQIDGMGGAHPLTSKVAILSKPTRPDADIDYLFLQVAVDKAEVSSAQNCGNMLAGVGPWAIENGWVTPRSPRTAVRIHMLNSGKMAVAYVPTEMGVVETEGQTAISGVPGTAPGISIEFLDIAGATTGALFPTGNKIDISNSVRATCIDNGMPVILMHAADLGITGYETPDVLETSSALKDRLEAIRLDLSPKMNLGDVRAKSVPKLSLLAPATQGGLVMTRTFIPHRVHQAIGVLGAVSVATGCLIPDTVGHELIAQQTPQSQTNRFSVEHPSGNFEVDLQLDGEVVLKSALVRTARKIMKGDVFVPKAVWSKK